MSLHFVLAPDSFKESLSAKEVAQAMAKGVSKIFPDARIDQIPMADGGEGTVEALVDATKGEMKTIEVDGPLQGQKVDASFGILGVKDTAVIEMAAASGLSLVEANQRNPLLTTTYGTGQLIKEVLDYGVREIVIGIGGSATNDGGAGMAQALGAKLLDKDSREIPRGGGYLDRLDHIDLTDLDERLNEVKIRVACDVNNPLCGQEGASAVFGPQKGADADMVKELDTNLQHYAQIIKRDLGRDVAHIEGAGAAGGLGAGLLAFTPAFLETGVQIVIDTVGLDHYIKMCDYVLTAEGGMDQQTQYGKTPFGVAQIGKKYGKAVFAMAGTLGEGTEILHDLGMTAIFSTTPSPMSLDQALAEAASNVERTSENIARMIQLIEKNKESSEK